MTSSIRKSLGQDFDRQLIGYTDLFSELERFMTAAHAESTTYPPFNIVDASTGESPDKNAEKRILIEIAVAGFKPTEIQVTEEDGLLIITGMRETTDSRKYCHQGISARKFVRHFRLAEYWKVENASFDNGILTVTLYQEIPEARKLKVIEVKVK